jgi:hypothetical protein
VVDGRTRVPLKSVQGNRDIIPISSSAQVDRDVRQLAKLVRNLMLRTGSLRIAAQEVGWPPPTDGDTRSGHLAQLTNHFYGANHRKFLSLLHGPSTSKIESVFVAGRRPNKFSSTRYVFSSRRAVPSTSSSPLALSPSMCGESTMIKLTPLPGRQSGLSAV